MKHDNVWVNKEGKRIKIKELENSHLMNIIKLIERNYIKAIGFYLIGPGPRGEMAQDAFDREFDILDEGGPSGFHKQYDILVEEADRRGIDDREQRENRLMSLDLAVLQIVSKAR